MICVGIWPEGQKKIQNSSGKAVHRGLMLQKEWHVKTVFKELEIVWLGKKSQKQTNRETKRSKFAHKRVRTHTEQSLAG